MSIGNATPIGSVGGGGSADVTMAITVLGNPTASAITISRAAPSTGTLDTWDLEYKLSTDSAWTAINGLTAATREVSGLTPERTYNFRATGHVLVDSTLTTTTATTIATTAPTVPSARAVIGQSQSLDYVFGGSGNTAGWWGYPGLTPAVTGPTAISWSVRVKNTTTMTWGKVAVPVLGGSTANASIIGAWIGTAGTGQTPGIGGWQQILFGGAGTKALAAGTKVVPSGNVSDTVTLAVPCAPNDSVIIRWVYASTGEISVFDSLTDAATTDSDMASCWMARADLGSTTGARDTVGSWEFWGVSPIHALFVEGVTGSPTAVSEQFVGDSVINAFRPEAYAPESASRDGWAYQYSLINDKAVRLCIAGNGGFTLVEYCQRLRALLPIYTPWVDVFVIEGWTPNGSPTTVGGNAPLKAALEETVTAIQAAGRGYAFIFPSPACLSILAAGAKDSLDDMVAYCQVRDPNLTMDLRLALADTVDTNNYSTTYSRDQLHQNLAGNIQFPVILKPLNEAVLTTGIGYTI